MFSVVADLVGDYQARLFFLFVAEAACTLPRGGEGSLGLVLAGRSVALAALFAVVGVLVATDLKPSLLLGRQQLVLATKNFLLLQLFSLLVALENIFLQLLQAPVINRHIKHLSCFLQRSRGQVDIHFNLVCQLEALHFCNDDRLCNFFSVCLVAAVVFNLHVQVETPLAPVELSAIRVRALESSLDFIGASSVVLLAAGDVALAAAAF